MRSPTATRPVILAVEDEAEHWQIYGKMLWYNGYDVTRACDGEEGLRLAGLLQPDLIVLDIMLPKLDGLELCRRLKASPATAHIPIVALSGRSRSDLGPQARDLDCVRYLEKPIGPVDLLHEVEQLIGRPPLPGEVPEDGDDPGPAAPRRAAAPAAGADGEA